MGNSHSFEVFKGIYCIKFQSFSPFRNWLKGNVHKPIYHIFHCKHPLTHRYLGLSENKVPPNSYFFFGGYSAFSTFSHLWRSWVYSQHSHWIVGEAQNCTSQGSYQGQFRGKRGWCRLWQLSLRKKTSLQTRMGKRGFKSIHENFFIAKVGRQLENYGDKNSAKIGI